MSCAFLTGDVLDMLQKLPDESVQCVVTSPPYWGLRDYGTPPQIWDGEPGCAHDWEEHIQPAANGINHAGGMSGETLSVSSATRKPKRSDFCSKCNAWRGSLGLEPTPDLYVQHVTEIFREVRRVLRKDGTLWLNIGDSYASGAGKVGNCPGGGKQGENWVGAPCANPTNSKRGVGIGPTTQPNRMPIPGLKPKDLVMMPARVALALQADGWYLRSDIIWAKNNPMPESVRDRPTTSHEHLFLFAKSPKYYYDHKAIMEQCVSGPSDVRKMLESKERIGGLFKHLEDPFNKASSLTNIGRKRSVGGTPMPDNYKGSLAGRKYGTEREEESRPSERFGRPAGWRETDQPLYRNARSVWTVNTQPFPGAHFATFPQKLVEPCILAGSKPGDVCLDPFSGAGTVALVALQHGRRFLGIELNPAYVEMAEARIQKAMAAIRK